MDFRKLPLLFCKHSKFVPTCMRYFEMCAVNSNEFSYMLPSSATKEYINLVSIKGENI